MNGNKVFFYVGAASCLVSAFITAQGDKDPVWVAFFIQVAFAYLILAKLEGLRSDND